MFSTTKIERFLRRFSVVEFSAVDFLDFLKTRHQKLPFLCSYDFFQNKAFLWSDFHLMVLLIMQEMHRGNVQLR